MEISTLTADFAENQVQKSFYSLHFTESSTGVLVNCSKNAPQVRSVKIQTEAIRAFNKPS